MSTPYDTDVVLWSEEQAHYLLTRQYDRLDLTHLADEVLDVGKSEIRALESRLSVLLAHLIKWAWQPAHRGSSWERTIRDQRKAITKLISKVPSLKHKMAEEGFWETVWGDAVYAASRETGIESDCFPEELPWSADDFLTAGWLPGTVSSKASQD